MCKRNMVFCVALAVLGGYSDGATAQETSTTKKTASQKSKVEHPPFDAVATQMFPKWDMNHDGKFAAKEIDIWMESRQVHGAHAAALATVRVRMRSTPKETRPNFSITLEELLIPEGTGPIVKPADTATGAKEHRFSYRKKYNELLKELEGYSPRLFAGDGPNFTVLKQGAIGDCFFFSVTGAIAAGDPKRIVSMIEPHPKGGFSVHLGVHTIQIREPTEAEAAINNSASTLSDGHWIIVLEEAVGKALDLTSKTKEVLEMTDYLAFGGNTGKVMEIYTGDKVDHIGMRDPSHAKERMATIRHEVPLALSHKRIVAATMSAPQPPQKKTPGLGYGHAYGVIAYDAKADKVTIWNPWGNTFTPKGPDGLEHGYTTEHGIFHVPLAEFYHHFSSTLIESNKKAAPPGPAAKKAQKRP
jgi:hypothetical protein